jgi:hypothetical protein
LAVSPDGEMLVVPERDASRDSTACELWVIETGERTGEIIVPGRAVMAAAFLGSGGLLTAVWKPRDRRQLSAGGTVCLWSPASRKVVASLDVHSHDPVGMAVLNERGRIALALDDGTGLVYEFPPIAAASFDSGD